MQYRAGQQVGPWLLSEFLGSGGNAEVWKAMGVNSEVVALKILRNHKPKSEPYQRFLSEIEVLRNLGPRRGILRLESDSLRYQTNAPPWIAMEIAQPITDALGNNPQIEEVVNAITDIAGTLAQLDLEGIHHRDIKPDNLFKVTNGWAVGDFGLASYPNMQALTEEGHRLGPMWYIAPEMLANPSSASGGPADVFSLAKTLWVLLTGQNYPPQGQLRTAVSQITLRSYVSHPRIAVLDAFLERATEYSPEARPTMSQFAGELQAWIKKPTIPAPPEDISELIARIHPLLVRQTDQKYNRQKQTKAFEELLEKIVSYLKPFMTICRRDLMGVEQTSDESKSPIQTTPVIWIDQILPLVNVNQPPILRQSPRIEAVHRPSGLPSSHMKNKTDIVYTGLIDMQLFEGGNVFFQAAHVLEIRLYVTPHQHPDSKYEVVWKSSQAAAIESALADTALDDLLVSWGNRFRESIDSFITIVEKNT